MIRPFFIRSNSLLKLKQYSRTLIGPWIFMDTGSPLSGCISSLKAVLEKLYVSLWRILVCFVLFVAYLFLVWQCSCVLFFLFMYLPLPLKRICLKKQIQILLKVTVQHRKPQTCCLDSFTLNGSLGFLYEYNFYQSWLDIKDIFSWQTKIAEHDSSKQVGRACHLSAVDLVISILTAGTQQIRSLCLPFEGRKLELGNKVLLLRVGWRKGWWGSSITKLLFSNFILSLWMGGAKPNGTASAHICTCHGQTSLDCSLSCYCTWVCFSL